MFLQNVKRWQWILISLIVGAGLGYLNHLPTSDWRSAFGETLTQQQFEEGLSASRAALNGSAILTTTPGSTKNAGSRIRPLSAGGNNSTAGSNRQTGSGVPVG